MAKGIVNVGAKTNDEAVIASKGSLELAADGTLKLKNQLAEVDPEGGELDGYATEEFVKNELEKGLESAGGCSAYSGTIGTNWTEDEDTGVKYQTVSIPEVTADNTAKVDHCYTGDGSADSYASFVEEENQYLSFITNGFAETVDGGIKFTIFGDAPTVSIPIVVEVS